VNDKNTGDFKGAGFVEFMDEAACNKGTFLKQNVLSSETSPIDDVITSIS